MYSSEKYHFDIYERFGIVFQLIQAISLYTLGVSPFPLNLRENQADLVSDTDADNIKYCFDVSR